MAKHAFLSASGASAWMLCPVKPWREEDAPEETNAFAEEGTKAHELLEIYLTKSRRTSNEFPIEMHGYIQGVTDYIDSQKFDQVYSEQRMDISFITGEEGAMGTADVVGIKDDVLTIIDLKYGMGVRVEAENNEQLLIYCAAALREFDLVGDIRTVVMVIVQPRIDHTSEWLLTTSDLASKMVSIETQAKRILAAKGGDLSANPGKTQCKFCRVKASCREYREHNAVVMTGTPTLFENLDYIDKIDRSMQALKNEDDARLANCLDSVDMIELWCQGVRKEVETRLLEDRFTDPRWKIVQGRAGNRKIADSEDILQIAREHGVKEDELFEREIKTVAKLEKIFKKKDPVFWAKVDSLALRHDGKPTVVPADDKRPALNLTLDFKAIETDYVEAAMGLTTEKEDHETDLTPSSTSTPEGRR